MNVLIIGSGGREHVLAWKVKQSPLVKKIYCAPGNGGIAKIAQCVDINVEDTEMLLQFAKDKSIGLTVVGPEIPLVGGIVDAFESEGLKIFGPNKLAAQLEGSKVFSKEFMQKYNIPTAFFKTFNDVDQARSFIEKAEFPLVIKADGLAAGKGVIICQNLEEGKEAINQIMEDKVFKEAGNTIIIEEYLVGEEISILAISDGDNYVVLETSQDHKRIFDDDLGPNTGGMGAYSPAPIGTEDVLYEIDQRVLAPTIMGMNAEGAPFKGVLYAGLMITEDGPYLLEYNVRFGDPEAQAVIPRMKSDLVEVMLASCDGTLDKVAIEWDDRACICVVISSGGYPGDYDKGCVISGLEKAAKDKDAIVFHAGTKLEDGKIVTSGGRVLGVTSFGDGIEDAIQNVYTTVEKITFNRCFFRRDIGAKALHVGNVKR